MPPCAKNSSCSCKTATWVKTNCSAYRPCCKQARYLPRSRSPRKQWRLNKSHGHDSPAGNLEPDALLVLPGHEFGLSRDVDHRAENERPASAKARKPPTKLVQR